MPKTAKNKANTIPSPKAIKWKWQPGSPVVVSNASKPREMTLDIVATRVNGVYIGFCTKSWANDEAAYVFPFEKALNESMEDGGDLAKEWKYVYSFLPRRDTNNNDGITAMKAKKGSKWDWKVVVIIIDEEDTSIEKAGRHIAHCFSKFTKNKNVMENPEKYTFNQCFTDKPQALNHYLLDLDVVKVLKSLVCLATEDYASKNDVLQNEELMDAFFGSSESGRAHLEDMDEEDWDYLLD